uniref:NIPSNAP domain-containing protein n=1 Tax=Panagrellus redivivus TaxID=6233 RepID=A0A7E4W9M0_PANRE
MKLDRKKRDSQRQPLISFCNSTGRGSMMNTEGSAERSRMNHQVRRGHAEVNPKDPKKEGKTIKIRYDQVREFPVTQIPNLSVAYWNRSDDDGIDQLLIQWKAAYLNIAENDKHIEMLFRREAGWMRREAWLESANDVDT